MPDADATPAAPSRWAHAWAVATVCAALPLLFLGAEVTTKKVGMADPKGFRSPSYLIEALWDQVRSGEMPEPGLAIEYAHRLAGMVVGVCAIVLAVSLLWTGRGWTRWFGLAALGAVIAQGLLGKYRVDLNALVGRDLALVHGCFAQLVFGLLTGVAVVTSRGWNAPVALPENGREATRLWRFALGTTILIYVQTIFGAVVRHRDVPFGARVHLAVAFAVVVAVALLVRAVFACQPRPRQLSGWAACLGGLVAVQVLLGIESWLTRFPSPLWNQAQPLPVRPEWVRSLHYFVGTLLFAASLGVTLQAYRRTAAAAEPRAGTVGRLEGAV
jgi:heme A synthase